MQLTRRVRLHRLYEGFTLRRFEDLSPPQHECAPISCSFESVSEVNMFFEFSWASDDAVLLKGCRVSGRHPTPLHELPC